MIWFYVVCGFKRLIVWGFSFLQITTFVFYFYLWYKMPAWLIGLILIVSLVPCLVLIKIICKNWSHKFYQLQLTTEFFQAFEWSDATIQLSHWLKLFTLHPFYWLRRYQIFEVHAICDSHDGIHSISWRLL